MKLYVASSWRNARQLVVVEVLREAGHEVYDFRNPRPGDCGFHWRDIDPGYQSWDGERYVAALQDPIAQAGLLSDKAALDWCDGTVLVLPCGRSAHLELGYTLGQRKPGWILLESSGHVEPELMYGLADAVCVDLEALLGEVGKADVALKRPDQLCGQPAGAGECQNPHS